MNDRWDLSYLYKSFEDEAFRKDLASLPEDIEKAKAFLEDASVPDAEKLEKLVSENDRLSAKVDALANFVQCTLAVDATNAAACAADDQLMAALRYLS